ncbi:beta-1 adrenergic receptor-like [Acanthaster planci]|uniref:Beta-1 adrenergic receptor-like n=1 Tax=Acanthaster planci TaxID=133434 RepID=A0A8B7YCJ9_ACAPL|nr:beta-1 adrenergic receptor-like [Acanthaster planci]
MFTSVLTTLTILMILLLNTLMLFTLRRVNSIQPTTKIFLASLTLSDLGSGLCWIPRLVELFAVRWLLGNFLCAIQNIVAFIFNSLSMWSLLLLTIDRYISISHPLRYPSLMTVFRSKVMVCSTWTVTFIIFILMYGTNDSATVSQDGPIQLCMALKDDWRVYLVAALFVISLATIFILYARISLAARNQARRIAAENRAGNGQGGQRVSTKSTTTIIIITGTLTITWAPAVIINGISPKTQWGIYDKYMIIMLAQALFLSNSWLNVVIYYLRNKDLRQELHRLLPCLTGANV